MKHERWIGRYVTIFRMDEDRIYTGRIDGWDHEKRRLQLGPKLMFIPLDDILKITVSEAGTHRRGPAAGVAARSHSVGYVMKDPIQFDNAIHFRSPVTVWAGDEVLRYRAVIVAHNSREVVLRTGEVLSKQEHEFVVRSVHGN
ncbi:hypothetical protein DCC85_14050 [Paenibacillus sp. CAA11]|uniref:hypothetical protein n=1 Tax=Paenibacillus sp. CAA11 TaxID=1532905 RepID=UPI000D3A2880|nr:hypothetical protein [Paenibacillus sp. CAA11]AWB45238.1 hypothetical protein DCC85_14050 [Paenibacillus sp. CAA11]